MYLRLSFFYIFSLLILIHSEQFSNDIKTTNSISDLSLKSSIYYDINTKLPVRIQSSESERFPSNATKFVSKNLPCSCAKLTCGCCAGINIEALNFTRKTCTNVTMVPEEFALDMGVIVNENEIIKRRVSMRNPPPVCVPLYALPIVTFCARFYDLRIVDSKLNMCIDFETKVAEWSVFILHFDCIRMSPSEITWVKPFEELNSTAGHADPAAPEIYDEVNFEASDVEVNNNPLNLTAEEEDQIGTLKL